MENNEKNVQDKQEVESTKMQKAGKIKTIILMLILLILVLAVGIGIGYVLSDKKIINKMDESTPTIQENEENVNEQYTLKMEKDKEYVYDAKYESNVSEDLYESEYLNDIKVPYININSEDAAKANDEIKEIYKKEINKYTKGALDEGSTIAECEYQYYINDNVLSIVLTVKSEDLVTYNYYTYNFSLNTGKKLEYNEIYEKAGLNSSNIDSKVESAITEKMREMMNNFDDVNYPEGTSFSTYNNESKNNYIKSVSNNSLNYFLSKDGNLNVVIALSIPAGLGETNTIIEITNIVMDEKELKNVEQDNQTTSENTSSNSNNSTYDKDAYVQKIKEINNEYSDLNLKYGLVYIDEDDVPELIVDCELYWQSIYKLKNGKVVSIAENDPYGTHGSSGYSYIPRKNIFIRYATDYDGYGYEIYDENMEMKYSVYGSFDGHYEKDNGIEITEEDFEELSYKNKNTIYLKDEAKMNENEIIDMLTK